MLVVVVEHERTDAQRRGVRGRHRDRGQRRELLAEVVGHEQRREAEVFELAGLVAPLRRRTDLRDLHAEPERLHGSLLSREPGDDRRERVDRVVVDRRGTTSASARAAPRATRRSRPRCRPGTAARAARRRPTRRTRRRCLRGSRVASSVTWTNPTSACSSRSSKRAPAASRTQPTFSSVASGRHRLRRVGRGAVARTQVRVDADDLRLARREREDLRRAAADEERHRLLHRLRHAVELGDLVVLAVERERARREQPLHDRDRLREPRDAHARTVERDAGLLVVGGHPARADAELEAAVGEQVERRHLARAHDGMLVVVAEHERADAQRARSPPPRARARPWARGRARRNGRGRRASSSRAPRPCARAR